MPETIQTDTDSSTNYSKKTITAIQLVNAGLDPKQALKAVNFKKEIRPETVSRFKQKVNKYALSRPKIQKLADDQITRILKGESREITQRKLGKNGEVVEYQEVIPCTDTNITSVLGLVLERTQPAVKANLNMNVNTDVHPVDLSRWLNVQSGADDRVMATSDADYVDITQDTQSSTR